MRFATCIFITVAFGLSACAPDATETKSEKPAKASETPAPPQPATEDPKVAALGGKDAICDVAFRALSKKHESISLADCTVSAEAGPVIAFPETGKVAISPVGLGDIIDLVSLDNPGSSGVSGNLGGVKNVAALFAVEADEANYICVGLTAYSKDDSSNSVFVYSSGMDEPQTFGFPVSEQGQLDQVFFNRPVARRGQSRIVALLPREKETELFELRFEPCK